MALVENEFTDIESTEHIIRNIEAREGKTRHSFQGIGHTTYLCFARKAFFDRKHREPSTESKTTKKTSSKTVKKPATKTTKKTSSKTTKKSTAKKTKKSSD